MKSPFNQPATEPLSGYEILEGCGIILDQPTMRMSFLLPTSLSVTIFCSNSIVLRTRYIFCFGAKNYPDSLHTSVLELNLCTPQSRSSSNHRVQDVVQCTSNPIQHKNTTTSPTMTSGGQKNKTGARTKKHKKPWASRERAGMSFIFVLAFFAVFGIIILTEV